MGKAHSKLVTDSLTLLNSLPRCKAFSITPGTHGAMMGISDILGCKNSRFFAIEIKTGNDTMTAKQKRFHREIHDAIGFTATCYSIDEVKKAIILLNNS